MEPISLLLLWLIGSIVLGVPEDTIVLVEDEDGKVGSIVVANNAGSQTISTANTAVTLSSRSSGPSAPRLLTREEISSLFQRALDAAPQAPQSFMLYFETGTSILTAESRSSLEQIIASFNNRKLARAMIIGHTDTVGDADGNYRLALDRATAIKQVLVNAGLQENVVDLRSHGETDLIVKTADNIAEPLNRRVEVAIW